MRRTRHKLVSSASACFALALMVPTLSAEELHWHAINGSQAFKIVASGDTCIAEGATVSVTRLDGASEPAGGAMAHLDMSQASGKVVTLSGLVTTTGTATNAALWLRADGAAPSDRVFQTTDPFPVHSGEPARVRQVRLTVPANATSVVYGVALKGGGAVHVTGLRLGIESAPTYADAPTLIDQAISTIQETALDAGKVDWDTFLKGAHSHLSAGQRASAAYPAIRDAVRLLNDGHNRFVDADTAWVSEVNDVTLTIPEVRVLPGGVGYVALPALSGTAEAGKRYTDAIAPAIARLAPEATRGWIVDLRQDTGGEMWPMLGAVRSLLGEGPVGAFHRAGEEDSHWYAMVGSSSDKAHQAVDLTHARVAVLVGPRTASSGEAVAIAFHGRPETRFFGLPTHGQPNANETASLKDGSELILKSFIDVDRHGEAFGGVITPDERVEGDAVMDRASAWLIQ